MKGGLSYCLEAILLLFLLQACGVSCATTSQLQAIGRLPLCAACITSAFSDCSCDLGDFTCGCKCSKFASLEEACVRIGCPAAVLEPSNSIFSNACNPPLPKSSTTTFTSPEAITSPTSSSTSSASGSPGASVPATPTDPPAPDTSSTSVNIVFHGAIIQGDRQSLKLLWPADGQNHTIGEIANATDSSLPNLEQLVVLSFSTGEMLNSGTVANCEFEGVDGLHLRFTNGNAPQGSAEPFVLGPPQRLTQGICSS